MSTSRNEEVTDVEQEKRKAAERAIKSHKKKQITGGERGREDQVPGERQVEGGGSGLRR